MRGALTRNLLLTMGLLVAQASWADIPGLQGGHLKTQLFGSHYPGDSLLRQAYGPESVDAGAEFRLRFAGRRGAWDVQADYQLLGRWGDTVNTPAALQDTAVPSTLPDDERRWWQLTDTLSDGSRHAVAQRLDRLSVGYTGERVVWRFGRQAISWGNGLIFNPVDVFNPFDPAAVDTEYKVGDDMLSGQYLLDSGSDWQLVRVERRDGAGDVNSDVSSSALKFHGFALEREYDLLVAEHYGDTMLAIGGSTNLGDAVLRGDVVSTDSADGWVTSAVLDWTWSWVWGGHNVSAVAEYYFNGFGLREGDYSLTGLAPDTALGMRLARGDLFAIGRHYLASSLQVELTPLLHLQPALYANVGDGSGLAQVVLNWDMAQDWQLLAALNVPLGPSGTEYGGLEVSPAGTLATGPGLFLQLGAWF
ncbi:hypothetical protein FV139_11520 [Parahaliea maris]|uniref:Alginate export domain-containing protein n=1 Tax=Parahaliea maris TaxID=2716870 RepID=A0A5C9A0C6_9GAMM|nr:hypothetical protein [Parahaliea maris]TXS94216.1 hypothetical protein FV139_11520 [Parahaliea maris]